VSNPYPSQSVTENLISQILAVGGTLPPSYGLGELERALEVALAAFHGGAGSSWPTVNGAGAGHLQAETAPGDSVGYSFIDRGTQGILLDCVGSGGVAMGAAAAGTGVLIADAGTNGINVVSTGSGGVSLTAQNAAGGITVQDEAGAGITVSSTGGVVELSGTDVIVGTGNNLAFYGVTPVARQSSTGITTVAQLVTALKNLGLLS
jgi:hypothetical protein